MGGVIATAGIRGGPTYFVYTTTIFETRAGAASAGLGYTSAGDITATTVGSGSVDVGDWIIPKNLASNGCTIRAHLNSGNTPSGDVLDSDLALSSSRGWSISQAGAGTKTSVLLITIKDKNGVTVKTGTITLTCTSS